MNQDWPGARWWRCDFHVHTPASHDVTEDITPEEWLEAARAAGLDAVAVTDHDCPKWIDRLKAAAAAMGDAPVLFPGVELTVDGCHLLVLFDPSADGDKVVSFLGRCGIDSKDCCRDGTTSIEPIERVLGFVSDMNGVAIAAHINGPKGLLEKKKDRQFQKLMRLPTLHAIETYARPNGDQQDLLLWVRGEKPDFPRRFPELAFSDAHSSGKIGSRSTWIKMNQPDIEGLRLALLDGPESVREHREGFDPNQHSPMWIRELRIKDGKQIGRSEWFTLRFSPWLNAIIGGRGSGKSTVIEFLRQVLRRDQELPDGPLRREFNDKMRIPEGRSDPGLLLATTWIEAIYVKDGREFRLSWRPDGSGAAFEVQEGGRFVPAQGEILQRCPARIYSQRQIFELASDPGALLQMLDQAGEVGTDEWRKRWQVEENQFLALRAERRQIENRLHGIQSLRGQLDDIKRKLALFESAGHAEILRAYQRRSRQRSELEHWRETYIDGLAARLREMADEIRPASINTSVFDAEADGEFLSWLEQQSAEVEGIATRLEGLGAEAETLAQNWPVSVASSPWAQRTALAKERYDELVARLREEGGLDPSDYGTLVQDRQLREREIADLEKLKERQKTLRKEEGSSQVRLLELRRERTKQRQHFLNQILEGNPHVRIQLVPYGDAQQAESDLRGLLETDRFEDLIGKKGMKNSLLGGLYPSSRSKTAGLDPEVFESRLADLKERLIKIRDGECDGKVDKRFVQRLQNRPVEVWDRLLLWFPEDRLNVEYRSRGSGKYRPIQQASQGQKTAALLSFLLAYGEEPVLLDQPEDDLDNELIYDLVVTQLRDSKLHRQLIVVTHNANLVVHGNAEWVTALHTPRGSTEIRTAGSLQEKSVRDAICSIMEGGREAFEKRYRRILHEGP